MVLLFFYVHVIVFVVFHNAAACFFFVSVAVWLMRSAACFFCVSVALLRRVRMDNKTAVAVKEKIAASAAKQESQSEESMLH